MSTAIPWNSRFTISPAIPAELGAALARYPAARALFEALSTADRRMYAEFVIDGGDADGRMLRAEQALTMMAERVAWTEKSADQSS